MAADSLLPLFHESNPEPAMSHFTESDDVLAELLGEAGEDLLASLLEPGSVYLNQASPPFSNPPLPASPHTPHSSCSPVDMIGNSPDSASPGDAMMMSSNVVPTDELGLLLGSIASVSSADSSSDVRIDVDAGWGSRGLEATALAGEEPSSGRKAVTLVLTEEEKQLLSAEGVELPTDMPLTKNEQKHLKRVRRKIKNKLSAQESRRKKKEYVEGLEGRVQCCTDTSQQLRQRVTTLEAENKSLLQQLQRLQSAVAHLYPGKLQAGSLLMVLSLCFSLMVWPRPPTTPLSSPYSVSVQSRSLLFTATDEFGNIIDPESGAIVSEQGGLSPKPPYPWSFQTPAFLSPTNKQYTVHHL